MATVADNPVGKLKGIDPATSGDSSGGNPSEVSSKPVKPRKHLSVEERYRIFLETQRGDVPIASVLRKWGIHSSDLTRIRVQVREGALASLAQGNRKGRPPKEPPEVTALKVEKARVEEALKELAIENTLLRKQVS